MPSEPDYCPFCGVRLSMDESLDDHFEDYAECGASFEQWRPEASPERSRGGPRASHRAIAWVLIATIMLYALLIQGSVLLGVIASGVVFVASRIDWASVA